MTISKDKLEKLKSILKSPTSQPIILVFSVVDTDYSPTETLPKKFHAQPYLEFMGSKNIDLSSATNLGELLKL